MSLFKNQLKEYETLREKYKLLPVKVSSFYQKKVDEEVFVLGHRDGPLHRGVYPCNEKVFQKMPFEVDDFIEDRENMPKESNTAFIHKYENRVLFLPLSHCLSNCMYCFRQDVLEEKESLKVEPSKDLLTKNLEALVGYLKKNKKIKEVILSGGDPMLLTATQLELIFQKIAKETSVKEFRMHSRTIVFDPRSFTEKHIQCLLKYKVRFVFHIVHPYELCETVKDKIKHLQKKGLRLYNQFPILRKINDHVDVLTKLIQDLDDLNVRNLSIFFPEPVHYSSAYRIHFARLFKLIDTFNQKTPSWVNATRFCQDTVHGKVRLENLIEYDAKKGFALFERNGIKIKVPDHPIEFDEAGDLKTLLWKG